MDSLTIRLDLPRSPRCPYCGELLVGRSVRVLDGILTCNLCHKIVDDAARRLTITSITHHLTQADWHTQLGLYILCPQRWSPANQVAPWLRLAAAISSGTIDPDID
jgi:hypothetical protein